MPYKCVCCDQPYATVWEVKKHFVKHIPSTKKALMCPYQDCNWYGSYEKEYKSHKKSHRHTAYRSENPGIEDTHAVKNPKVQEIRDNVAVWYDPDETDEETARCDKVSSNNGHRKLLEISKTTKNISTKLPTKENVPPQTKGPLTTERKPASQKIDTAANVLAPTSEVLTEKETGSNTTSVALPKIVGDEILKTPEVMLSPLSSETPLQDEHFIVQQNNTKKLTEAEDVMEDEAPVFQPRKVRRIEDRAYEVLNNFIEDKAAMEIPTEVIREEFVHLRQDNSHHAMKMGELVRDLVQEVHDWKRTTTTLITRVMEETTSQRSEFQTRLEIAGYGAQLLDALGSRHGHGRGFSNSCDVCQRGNDALIALVGMTDRRLIEPFKPSFL